MEMFLAYWLKRIGFFFPCHFPQYKYCASVGEYALCPLFVFLFFFLTLPISQNEEIFGGYFLRVSAVKHLL